MQFNIGDDVVLLPPFAKHFPGVYVVELVSAAEDGQPIVYLVGIEAAFAPQFLARAE